MESLIKVSRRVAYTLLAGVMACNDPIVAQTSTNAGENKGLKVESTQGEVAMKSTPTIANVETVADVLRSITKSEIDQYFYLQEAIKCLESQDVKVNLTQFQKECEDNITKLSSLTRRYGKDEPLFKKGLTEKIAEQYLVFRSLVGEESVIKTLRSHLQHIFQKYEDASRSNLPDDVKREIRPIQNCTQSHIAYIDGKISKKGK